MKKTVKKVFLDIQKEEEWLNEQGETGLMLIGYKNGEYIFEDVSPAKYQYKIDIPNYSGKKKKEYLDFLEQTGISVITEYGGRVYLKKNKSEGSMELYTGQREIKKQIGKRYTHFFSISVFHLIFGIFLLTQSYSMAGQRGPAFIITLVFGTIFVVSGIVLFIYGLWKHRQYAMPGEDKDIWED